MAVFNATQNQVLFNPVSEYYRGNAMRSQQAAAEQQLAAGEQSMELRDLQIKQAKQEIEDAPEKRRIAAMKAAADYEGVLLNIQEKRLKIGDIEMENTRDAVGPFIQEYGKRAEEDEDAAIVWANKEFGGVIGRLSPERQQEYMMAAGEDKVLSHEELNRIGLGIRVYEAEKDPDPTSHQQVLDDLVEKGYMTKERRNEILEAQEVKAGTIVGRTPEDAAADPRSKQQVGAAYQEHVDSFNTSSDVQELITSSLPQVLASPGTVGIRGAVAVGLSGVLSSLGQDAMADKVSEYMAGATPEEITQIQTELQVLRGRIIPLVTGEQGKRLSETEREIASRAVGLIEGIQGPADLSKAYPQVVGAMRQLYAESWATKYRTASQDENIQYPYDLSKDDEMIELLTEFSNAGVDIGTAKRTVLRLQSIQGVE